MKNLSPFYDTFYWAIKNTWPMLTLFIVILTVLKVTHVIINKEKMILYKEFYNLLAIIYILLLYFLLLSTENASSGINFIPFREMTRYSIGSFGYFVSDYLKAKKTSHILIVSILISLTAELIQYKIGRAFDVDDIILNVVGAIIGFMCYISVIAIKHHLPKFLQNNIFYNLLAIIVFIAILVLFGSIWGVHLW